MKQAELTHNKEKSFRWSKFFGPERIFAHVLASESRFSVYQGQKLTLHVLHFIPRASIAGLMRMGFPKTESLTDWCWALNPFVCAQMRSHSTSNCEDYVPP